MTDHTPGDPPPPPGTQPPEASAPHAAPDGSDPGAREAAGSGTAQTREWLADLERLIQEIADQAAPVARQVAAKAAELASVAAVKAGPAAQRVGTATAEASQKFAERAQAVASELRTEAPEAPTSGEGALWEPGSSPDATRDERSPASEPDPGAPASSDTTEDEGRS